MTNEADKPGVRGFFKRLRAKLNQGPAWLTADLTELLPGRKIDATHPDIYLDHDRCILCSRCIRASRMEDGKTVFGFEGRGIAMRLNVDAQGGLGDTQMAAIDKAARVCPVACIVIKRDSYRVPNGSRRFDKLPIGSEIEAKRKQVKS